MASRREPAWCRRTRAGGWGFETSWDTRRHSENDDDDDDDDDDDNIDDDSEDDNDDDDTGEGDTDDDDISDPPIFKCKTCGNLDEDSVRV